MPSRKTHLTVDQLVFGRTFPKVHRSKDVYARYLGPSHRRVAHDPVSNVIIAMTQYPEDPLGAMVSATLHDLLDLSSTALKRASRKRK